MEEVGRVPSPGDVLVVSPAALVAQGPSRASHPAGSPRVPMMASGDRASGPSVQPQPELPWGLPGTLAASPPPAAAERSHGDPLAGPLRPPRPLGEPLL